jgi:hypothetical protein
MGCLFGLHLQSLEPIWQNPRPLLLRVQEVEVVGVGDPGVEVAATGVAVGVVGEVSGVGTVTVMEVAGVITNNWGHPAEMGAVVQCGIVPLSRPTAPAAAAMQGVIFIPVGMTAGVTVGLVTISAGMTAGKVVAVTTTAGMTAGVTAAAKVVAMTTIAEMIEAMEAAAAAVADTNLIRSVFTMRKFNLFLFHFHLVDCIHKCEINANLTLN